MLIIQLLGIVGLYVFVSYCEYCGKHERKERETDGWI